MTHRTGITQIPFLTLIAGGACCNRTIVIDDGVFGHFGKLLHSDRQLSIPRILLHSRSGTRRPSQPPNSLNGGLFCDILGPSGDDDDVVGLGVPIAGGGGHEVEVGDWIAFPRMGSEVLTPANPKSHNVPVPVEAGSSYW